MKEGRIIFGHRQELWLKRLALKSRERLDYDLRCELDRWLKKHPTMNELYWAKERLFGLYRTRGVVRANQALRKLIEEWKASAQPAIRRLGKTMWRWRKEVLLYFENGYTNAFTEATNNTGKLCQKRAYGYKSFKNYRLRLLCACLLWKY